MKSWEMLKKTIPMFFCLSKNSTQIEKEGVYLFKSGVNHSSCNFAIIENNDPVQQKNLIEKYFNCPGLIISNEESKKGLDSWTKNKNFKYLGKFPLMSKEQKNIEIEYKDDNNIKISRVSNQKTFKDFFLIFTKLRNLTQEESVKMFSTKMLDYNYFLYVAYYNERPAGILVSIKVDNQAIVLETGVFEEFRELGIFKMFTEKNLYDAINNKFYNYSALPTSKISYKVATEFGFKIEGSCHIWQK